MSHLPPHAETDDDETFYDAQELQAAPPLDFSALPALPEAAPPSSPPSGRAPAPQPAGPQPAAAQPARAEADIDQLMAARMARMRHKSLAGDAASVAAFSSPAAGAAPAIPQRPSRPSTMSAASFAQAHAQQAQADATAVGPTVTGASGVRASPSPAPALAVGPAASPASPQTAGRPAAPVRPAAASAGPGYRTAPAAMLSAVVAAEAAAASVLTSPPSHTSAASAAAAAPVAAVRPLQPRGSLQRAPGAGEALDMHLIIKNLDSGEACHVSEASAVFPEVQQAARAGEAATRPATAAGAAAVAVAAPAAAAAAQEQEHEVASSNGSSGGSGRGFWSLFRRGKKDTPAEQGEATAARGRMGKRVKVKAKKKAVQELSALTLRQQVPYHSGPIWTMKWSPCGAFLATAGHDGVIAVWAVAGSPAAQEIANRPSGADSGNYLAAAAAAQAANTAAAEAAASQQAAGGAGASVSVSGSEAEASTSRAHSSRSQSTSRASSVTTNGSGSGASGGAPGAEAAPLLHPVPYLVWVGHKADVVDLSWSAGYFLLSASIDKTVRLWHISRPKCILIFQHTDFVTSVAFHPVDDRYFLSGSFDKRLRIWSVPQHRVVEWAQAPAIITAAAFSPDGADAVAGLAHGQVVVYRTEQLKYRTQIECKNRSGKHKAGRKVTGLEFSPNGHYLLVTTNDSRIRLVNFKDFSLESKYKGLQNEEMQLRASFSPNGSRIVCGSEDGACFLWETLTGANGKDNHIEACESFAASEPGAELVTVTCAMFVPFAAVQTSAASAADLRATTHIFATAGFDGAVRFFENKAPPVKL